MGGQKLHRSRPIFLLGKHYCSNHLGDYKNIFYYHPRAKRMMPNVGPIEKERELGCGFERRAR